jgi:hypothetical protein
MPVEEMSDADLVALARSGDADGFRVLASRYRAMAMMARDNPGWGATYGDS